jgi:hypothetical protein
MTETVGVSKWKPFKYYSNSKKDNNDLKSKRP